MKVYLDSVGCRLNQAEIERLASQLARAGHELTGSPEGSDYVLLNTCAVTAAAAADSRSLARRAHHINPKAKIILTGCWSTLEPEWAASLPGAWKVVPNQAKERSLQDLAPISNPSLRVPVPGPRRKTRATIKVQDGCDFVCSFCVTTLARGASRSIPAERVLEDVRAAEAAGAKEVVLSGVSLGSYSSGGLDLAALIRLVLDRTHLPRLRLSSVEPWGLTDAFFKLWEDSRLCRHLHLPLQSGSDATLRRMKRPIRSKRFAELIHQARGAIPGVALTTDLMVGFPGETEADFAHSLAFVGELSLAGAHIFTYSPRRGTEAATLPGQIDPSVQRQRAAAMREQIQASSRMYRAGQVGAVLDALWISTQRLASGRWSMRGLTDNNLKVRSTASANLRNHLSRIQLQSADGDAAIL